VTPPKKLWRPSAHHDDLIQVVIDRRTAELLRIAAEVRDIDVELLMVHLLIAASRRIDELLDDEGEDPETA
jgi:hypothetical protein